MKSFQHMMKLRKWASECKEFKSIVTSVPKLVPSMEALQPAQIAATLRPSQLDKAIESRQEVNSILKYLPRPAPTKATLQHAYSSFKPCGSQYDSLRLEESGKSSGAQNSQASSGSDFTTPGVPLKRFYPAPDELFNAANKSQGRSILALNHEEAHKSHKENFRIVRSWFAAYATNKELYDFLNEDFKVNTETKESCRQYMRSRMHELLPLRFLCPETGAKHEMPWPESFLFEVVKNRKHEWRKANNKKKNDSITCSQKQEPTNPENLKAIADKDELLAIEYCEKYPEYALQVFAFSLKQTLQDLQSREGSVPYIIQGQHNGATFGRGIVESVHVIDSVRCFKVKFMESTIFKPSENKWVGGLWLPFMTHAKGLQHLQVQQIELGMTLFIPCSQCAMSPNLASTICTQRLPSISSLGDAFDKEGLQHMPLDEPLPGKTQSSGLFAVEEEDDELKIGVLPTDSICKSSSPVEENNEAEVEIKDIELTNLTHFSQGKESSTSTVHLSVACFSESQEGISSGSDATTELGPEHKRQKIKGPLAEQDNQVQSKVKILKDLKNGGVLAKSKGNLDSLHLSRPKRGKVPSAGKENAPSFSAISTKGQEDARERLLKGKKMTNKIETQICTSGSRTRLSSLSHTLEDNKIDVEKLSAESKLVVCMRAMKLLRISEVEGKVKGFIQEINRRCKTSPKPFTKHTQKTTVELVEMVAKWCIEQKVVIIRDPPDIREGVQRLFPENVILSSGQDVITL